MSENDRGDNALNVLATGIKRERKRHGLNQSDVARLLGMAKQSISNWESGRSTPTLSNLIQLASLFNVSPAVFFLSDPRNETSLPKRTGLRIDQTVAASMSMVPLVSGTETAAGLLRGELDIKKIRVLGYVSSGVPLLERDRGVAILVQDDANAPEINPGETLVIEPMDASDIRPGSIVLALVKGRPLLGQWRPTEIGEVVGGRVQPVNDTIWPAATLAAEDQILGCVTTRIQTDRRERQPARTKI